MVNNTDVFNINKAQKCKFREYNNDLCGGTKSCKLCSYMKRIIELWKSFCNIATDDRNFIKEEWNNFPIGTYKVDIIEWFRQTYEVDVYSLEKMTGVFSGYYHYEV